VRLFKTRGKFRHFQHFLEQWKKFSLKVPKIGSASLSSFSAAKKTKRETSHRLMPFCASAYVKRL